MHSSAWRVALLIAGLNAAPAGATEPADARLVTVTGSGEVRAPPDRASITLGILVRSPLLATARAEANRTVAALLAIAHASSVADSDLRTTRISVSPEYDSADGRRAPRLIGYSVQRQLIVDLRDIDRLGELIEKALGAGANLAFEPLLDSSRRADLEREALATAVADARANAGVIARALDGTLGAARRITQGPDGAESMASRRARIATAAAVAAPETYQPGELTFSANVTASFDFVPGAAPR